MHMFEIYPFSNILHISLENIINAFIAQKDKKMLETLFLENPVFMKIITDIANNSQNTAGMIQKAHYGFFVKFVGSLMETEIYPELTKLECWNLFDEKFYKTEKSK